MGRGWGTSKNDQLNGLFLLFFMPPTLKKLKGQIALGLSVYVSVRLFKKNSVTALKFHK